jgi:hypothetical protein
LLLDLAHDLLECQLSVDERVHLRLQDGVLLGAQRSRSRRAKAERAKPPSDRLHPVVGVDELACEAGEIVVDPASLLAAVIESAVRGRDRTAEDLDGQEQHSGLGKLEPEVAGARREGCAEADECQRERSAEGRRQP